MGFVHHLMLQLIIIIIIIINYYSDIENIFTYWAQLSRFYLYF